jgi:hypothetical protein
MMQLKWHSIRLLPGRFTRLNYNIKRSSIKALITLISHNIQPIKKEFLYNPNIYYH